MNFTETNPIDEKKPANGIDDIHQALMLDYDAFIRSLARIKDTPSSILLGAGASITSGVKPASDCIWDWKSEIYNSKNPNAPKIYRNTKSEAVRESIQKWLDSTGNFPPEGAEDEYSFYAEHAYPIPEDRRLYFQSLIQQIEPYVGYQLICLLAKSQIIKSLWTTNFDGLGIKAANQAGITTIDITLDSVHRLHQSRGANEMLHIALHGDYKFGELKNTSTELDNQNEVLVEHLGRECADNHLIVTGYSGRDKSLMNALEKVYSSEGAGRLYWCGFGHEISEPVANLIQVARENGREAFFVPTEGFDKMMIHVSKACLAQSESQIQSVVELLSSHRAENEINIEPFRLEVNRSDKWLKSNLHPFTIPKEVFQFTIQFKEGEKPWSTIKKLTRESGISAVPFKSHIFAFGTLSEIHEIFGSRLSGEVRRTPISLTDVSRVSAFQALILQSIVRVLGRHEDLSGNRKDAIWNIAPNHVSTYGEEKLFVHHGVAISLFFDSNLPKFAYLSLKPEYRLECKVPIPKDLRLKQGKVFFEGLFNNRYDEYLEEWRNRVISPNKMVFDYPQGSASGFKFTVSRRTAFAEVKVLDPHFRAYRPSEYDRRLTRFRGVQFMEPSLVFANAHARKMVRDYHPMRALVRHHPFDNDLNGVVHSTSIDLGFVCDKKYGEMFSSFIQGLNNSRVADKNPDYLIDYPGFAAAYNLPLNVPDVSDSQRWEDLNFTGQEGDVRKRSVALAQMLCSRIQRLADRNGQIVIAIFIPTELEPYKAYEHEGEVFNLHDYVKAYSAARGVATQFIEEKTLSISLRCQKYWWLSLSFYVKSMRTPWILEKSEQNVAFAGIGYRVNRNKEGTEIVLGCSHIYDSAGQGLKYRLSKVDDFHLDRRNNPFMSFDDAFEFGVAIRELFLQSMDRLPERVVVHKRTRFTPEEISGITESLGTAGVTNIDLIEVNHERDSRFLATRIYGGVMQTDAFPLSRGTCLVVDEKTALLWTHGIVPSVRNPDKQYFQGGRGIPAPLKIVRHHGNSTLDQIGSEILGLTKMNWNSFDLYAKLPATIDSSNTIAKIGALLSRFEGTTYDYRLFI